MKTRTLGPIFWKFIKYTYPIVDQPYYIILTDQDKGSLLAINDIVPSAGKIHCSFHCQQNIVKKCGGGKGHKPLTALWLCNPLCDCKSVTLLTATRIRCTPLTLITSSPLPMNCNSQLQGVFRAVQFTCTKNQHLLLWNQCTEKR